MYGVLRLSALSVAAAVAALTGTLAAPAASAQDCQSLWVERNSYYKEAGYCFKTARAIAYFGNGGCYIYDESQIRFPPGIWARIRQIRRMERDMGCPV
jgi:YARHG domain